MWKLIDKFSLEWYKEHEFPSHGEVKLSVYNPKTDILNSMSIITRGLAFVLTTGVWNDPDTNTFTLIDLVEAAIEAQRNHRTSHTIHIGKKIDGLNNVLIVRGSPPLIARLCIEFKYLDTPDMTIVRLDPREGFDSVVTEFDQALQRAISRKYVIGPLPPPQLTSTG